MPIPVWVSEGSVRKYHRAVEQLRKENAQRKASKQPLIDDSEEAAKELYIRMGGLVPGDASTVHGVPAGSEEVIAVAVEEAEKPKRKPRAKKEENEQA